MNQIDNLKDQLSHAFYLEEVNENNFIVYTGFYFFDKSPIVFNLKNNGEYWYLTDEDRLEKQLTEIAGPFYNQIYTLSLQYGRLHNLNLQRHIATLILIQKGEKLVDLVYHFLQIILVSISLAESEKLRIKDFK